MDLVDSDSSADGPEDVEEFEDAPESFIIEDDMFIDNTRSTKIQRLSTFVFFQIADFLKAFSTIHWALLIIEMF